MEKIFVLIEHDGKSVSDTAFELAEVARSFSGNGGKVTGLLAGFDVSTLAAEAAGWFDELHVWNDRRLAEHDGDLLGTVLAPLIETERPQLVLAAHTNNTMDLVPGLAVRLGRPLLTDCLSVMMNGDVLSAVRPAYGGKVHLRVTASKSDNGYIATLRPGATVAGASPGLHAEVVPETVSDSTPICRRYVRTVSGDANDVDISQAERIVAVGRGIEDEEGLNMIRSLADALGAEVACSRPVVDKQWLPKSRQVGTSGKSVRPKLYVAIGISGSFQHMGGIKGNPFMVAINKDPRAPIFALADVGIVADLFDVVPALEMKIRELKD